jgi:HNH endonuclease
VGDYLLQALPEPDAGYREGHRNGGSDAGKRPIPRLLLGDDLCRLPGWRQSGQCRSVDIAVLADEVLQVSARGTTTCITRRLEREGVMSSDGPIPPRLRLDAASYEQLRQQVLRRDGWRCQFCGTMTKLEIHHKQFRSHSGSDSEENLIRLCSTCHAGVHSRRCQRRCDIWQQA